MYTIKDGVQLREIMKSEYPYPPTQVFDASTFFKKYEIKYGIDTVQLDFRTNNIETLYYENLILQVALESRINKILNMKIIHNIQELKSVLKKEYPLPPKKAFDAVDFFARYYIPVDINTKELNILTGSIEDLYYENLILKVAIWQQINKM